MPPLTCPPTIPVTASTTSPAACSVSPTLVEGYVSAASKISRLALGHETAPDRKVYHVREDYSQEDHVDGLPFGTRGGMLIHHYFPADGEYTISWMPIAEHGRLLYGGDSEDEQLEVTLDGERVKLFEIGQGRSARRRNRDKNEVRVTVKAGPAHCRRRVSRDHLCAASSI